MFMHTHNPIVAMDVRKIEKQIERNNSSSELAEKSAQEVENRAILIDLLKEDTAKKWKW